MFRIFAKVIFALNAWEVDRIAKKTIPNRSKDSKMFKKQRDNHKACEETFRRMREANIASMNVTPRDPKKYRKTLTEIMELNDG